MSVRPHLDMRHAFTTSLYKDSSTSGEKPCESYSLSKCRKAVYMFSLNRFFALFLRTSAAIVAAS